MTTTTDTLENELARMFETAETAGHARLTVSVQDLHNAGEADGNLPGDTMAQAEAVLRAAMGAGDTRVDGDTFAVDFALPRG